MPSSVYMEILTPIANCALVLHPHNFLHRKNLKYVANQCIIPRPFSRNVAFNFVA
jgi:hypothetical protein